MAELSQCLLTLKQHSKKFRAVLTPDEKQEFAEHLNDVANAANEAAFRTALDRLVTFCVRVPPLEELLTDAPQEYWSLNEEVLEKLQNEGPPENTLRSLKPLKNQAFLRKDDFLKAIEELIGQEQTTHYKEPILEYTHKVFVRGEPIFKPLLKEEKKLDLLRNQLIVAEVIKKVQQSEKKSGAKE